MRTPPRFLAAKKDSSADKFKVVLNKRTTTTVEESLNRFFTTHLDGHEEEYRAAMFLLACFARPRILPGMEEEQDYEQFPGAAHHQPGPEPSSALPEMAE